MNRTTLDQAVELLTRAQRGILLAVPPEPATDPFAAMLALALALDQLGKPTTMVSPSFVPDHLQFLPGTSQVQHAIATPADLILELPLGSRRIRDVQWETAGDLLRMTIAPDGEPLAETEIRAVRRYPWDLTVTLGVPRREALGDLRTAHPSLWTDTPLLNIDAGTANTFFGTTNLVSATASTVSEVALDLLETLGGVNVISREVATCLFAGISAGTESFRSPAITPQTFRAASLLLEQEAAHQEIVRHLFQTHTLSELRILGRTLARLEEVRPDVLVTFVESGDFADTDATSDTLPRVLKEIREWAGIQRTILLAFTRTPGTLEALASLGERDAHRREALQAALGGVPVGPFLLLNLGSSTPERARPLVTERILPLLAL